jgi:transposase
MSQRQISAALGIPRSTISAIVCKWRESSMVEEQDSSSKAKKKSVDYHSEMNAETFEEWLQDKLLPALTIIVLDNASYHSRLEEKKPTCAWRKAQLQTWLQNNNIPFSETDKKDTLLKLCRQNDKSPVYVVDRVIHEAGHKPLRLPPYH